MRLQRGELIKQVESSKSPAPVKGMRTCSDRQEVPEGIQGQHRRGKAEKRGEQELHAGVSERWPASAATLPVQASRTDTGVSKR